MQYKATDLVIPGPGKFELVFTPAAGGAPQRHTVFDFQDSGVALGMYNTDKVFIALSKSKYNNHFFKPIFRASQSLLIAHLNMR